MHATTRRRLTSRGNPAFRFLDRYAGIPLVGLLGVLPRRPHPSRLDRIGLLRTAAIGDTLLLAGPLRDLRNTWPGADIAVVTGDENAAAGAMIARGLARHVVISPRSPLGAAAVLRRQQFDVLIDTGAWPRLDALLTALSGARFRVGFRTTGEFRHFAYDLTVEHSATVHELDNFRALLRALGIHGTSSPELSRDGLPTPGNLPAKPFIVFHPWSAGYRGFIKEWPQERWVQLALRLLALAPTIVITGSAAQAQQSLQLAALIESHGVKAMACTGVALPDLAALLCESQALVSVNTGVMHLGAQLGVRTVALDGPTPARRWGPVGPHAVSVATELPGCGYLNLGFEYDGRRIDCMNGISVDAVEAAVRTLVARRA